jgi:hypothetical protein
MSLLAQVRAGLDTAWEALGDLKVEVDYTRIVRGAYNPGTGTVTQTVTKIPLTVGLVDYTDEQRANSDMQSGDQRVLMRAKDLPFKPQDEDVLTEKDGTIWTVKQVAGDKRLYWDLRVRQ